ncbi:MAG: ATP synthase F1 subunit delta [Bacteroidales bacterium]|nr:ATP synthase F1 subunit delta [Bacteroidales bacterium]
MNELKLQTRYAQSLFDLAKETNVLEDVYKDILAIKDVCLENRELQVILRNPIIKPLQKKQLILSLFENSCKDITIKFLSLIISKRRDIYLLGICNSFIEIYRKDKNIKTAEIIVGSAISEELSKEIESQLEEIFHTDVYLTTKVNPKIIGGFCLTIDGKQYDASFLKKLSVIRKELTLKA